VYGFGVGSRLSQSLPTHHANQRTKHANNANSAKTNAGADRNTTLPQLVVWWQMWGRTWGRRTPAHLHACPPARLVERKKSETNQ
jgi:hypothetical protein